MKKIGLESKPESGFSFTKRLNDLQDIAFTRR